MDYPYTSVLGRDVTDPEARCSVEIRFNDISISGLSEQDIVDAVRDRIAQEPNVSVTATRHEVTETSV